VKLRLPTSSLINHNMRLSGSNCSNLQVQAALTAVTDVIKESVWFIFVCCFFTVGSAEFLQLLFVIFVVDQLVVFRFVREECENNFENHWYSSLLILILQPLFVMMHLAQCKIQKIKKKRSDHHESGISLSKQTVTTIVKPC